LLLYPYPFHLQEKLKDKYNFFSYEGEISKLNPRSHLAPLFPLDEEEQIHSDILGQHDFQISLEEAINECESNYLARLSEHQHPFIICWDYEGFVHWDEENGTVDLALNELQIVAAEDPEIPVKLQPIDLQLRLNRIIGLYNDGKHFDVIESIHDLLQENYKITEFLIFNLECIVANSYRMIGENEKSVETFSRIEERFLNKFSNEIIDYLVDNHIKISETNDASWNKGIFNWDVGTVHYYWAYALYEQEKYQDALVHFTGHMHYTNKKNTKMHWFTSQGA
jgi:tetratricopeptide (TPR) repeat protein